MNTYKLKRFIFASSSYSFYIFVIYLKFKRGDTFIYFFLFLKRIYLVLDAFKVSLFALNQSSILESSKFAKSYKSCTLFGESCSVVSLAKRIVKNLNALGRSLIRIWNKIGPNIEPYGTPQEISSSGESTPLIEVNCFLPLK